MQAMNTSGMNIARLAASETLVSLGSCPTGLSGAEALRRLDEFGPNRIEPLTGQPLWLGLLMEFSHFFALILWLAAALAFLAEHFDPGQGMMELGFAIVGVIVVNGLFSFWQAYRAQRALAALRELLPHQVDVVRDGRPLVLPAADLVPGDLLVLAEGAQVPADCRIIEAWGLRANLATLTGESRPRSRSSDTDATSDPLGARNLLLAGTLVVSGECRAAVYATGMNTEFGRIAHLTQTLGETESPLQREIRRVSKLVAVLAVTTPAVSLPASALMWATAMAATAAAGTDSCAGCPALPAHTGPGGRFFYVCAQRGWGIGPCASRNKFAIKIVAACAFSISARSTFC